MRALLTFALCLASPSALASQAGLISCGVPIAKREILSNKTYRSTAIGIAWQKCKTQAPDNIGITEFGNMIDEELDKYDEIVSTETFEQPRDGITSGEVYSVDGTSPPIFNVDRRCGLYPNVQNRNQCIQMEQNAYDALKSSWMNIDKRAKVKCSHNMWHWAGKQNGNYFPNPYSGYMPCLASWDEYFKNSAPDSSVKQFKP